MDVDAVQGGEVAELHNDVIEPDHNGFSSFCIRNKEIRRAGEIPARLKTHNSRYPAEPLRGTRCAGSPYAAFWVRVAQSRLAQSGSATAAEASAQ